MIIRVVQGKGGKDRDIPLSPALLETLRAYWHWSKAASLPVSLARFQRSLVDPSRTRLCGGHVAKPHARLACASVFRPIA